MGREHKTPPETSGEFRERAIQERIDVILGEHLQETERYYQAGDRIMEGLDQETARKFEEFVSEYVTISGKEYRMIYLGGLADGLRLGAMAFGGWGRRTSRKERNTGKKSARKKALEIRGREKERWKESTGSKGRKEEKH